MIITKLFENIDYTVLSGSAENTEVSRIEYNSRKINPGELFVCLPGARVDGHSFAESAYRAGCRAFLCERPLDLPKDAFVAAVPDTRSALADISATFYGYPAKKLHIIGITGTKGKTTTALLIQAILNGAGLSCAYIGSNGVIIGEQHMETVNTTPESREMQHYFAAMVRENVRYAVIEVSSQALEHNRVQGLSFDACVFTNLSPDHISDVEHASFEDYRDAKRKLFTSYPCKLAVVNSDDQNSDYMINGTELKRITYGVKNESDFFASSLDIYRDETSLGITFDCTTDGITTPVSMRTPGAFSVSNGLAAIAVASHFGVSVQKAAEILAVTPVNGRFEIVDGLPNRTYVIDYAHNGLSLTSTLSVLREYNPARLICVFGSVGNKSQNRRRELAEAASALADYCIITSDNPDRESPSAIIDDILTYFDKNVPYEVIVDRSEAVERAVEMSREGDIVLFAGKGHERYQYVFGEKIPFCERDIIKETCRVLTLREALNG